jgi:protein phosphatase PTC7
MASSAPIGCTHFFPTLISLLLHILILPTLQYQSYLRFHQTSPSNILNAAAFSIPRIDKVKTGSEDSFFVSNNILAIADGVGGNHKQGIDPAFYSRGFMSNLKDYSEECLISKEPLPPIKKIINEAYQRTNAKGSSTVVALKLNADDQSLETGQVGDSGFIILRKNQEEKWEIVVDFVSMQIKFNMPLQLSKGHTFNNPDKGVYKSYNIQNNDIIIVGSDGVWDNLFDDQIIGIVEQNIENGILKDPKQLAEDIVNIASSFSIDEEYDSPFAIKAREHGLLRHGGKQDDITVIVAQVHMI